MKIKRGGRKEEECSTRSLLLRDLVEK